MGSALLKDGLEAYERRDDTTALQILGPLAEGGNAIAQYTIGKMCVQGRASPEGWAEALKWYRLAAAQGHAGSQTILGDWYKAGGDDKWESVKWYRKAAEQGHPEAQFQLGSCYEHLDLMQDPADAVKWYRMAAAQGQINAQLTLGQIYAIGNLVAEDLKEAMKWYRLAAEQGDTDGQYELGKMYDERLGVKRDAVEALKWLNLAASSCDLPAIADRDALAAKLTPAEVAEAERLAQEWKPK
jgi:TPR repeat protein